MKNAKTGLGKQLNQEVKSATQIITMHPQAWTMVETHYHRMLVRRFSYGLLYSIGKEEIVIIAVMHLNREPGYWKEQWPSKSIK
jgi:hypothetical protein